MNTPPTIGDVVAAAHRAGISTQGRHTGTPVADGATAENIRSTAGRWLDQEPAPAPPQGHLLLEAQRVALEYLVAAGAVAYRFGSVQVQVPEGTPIESIDYEAHRRSHP